MFLRTLKKVYKLIVIALILTPNLFVIVLGIESFPYTCAPMFGQYIDDSTHLYLMEFEGVNDTTTIDLTDYYGKPEDFFIRHFFSKVYGSTDAISPFTNKLSESPEAFQLRMDEFFNYYSLFIKKEYGLSFERINLKALRVNQNRDVLETSKIIGYFDSKTRSYNKLLNK